MNETLAALRADLDALRQALGRDDFAGAGQILAAHDERLRGYIRSVGVDAPVEALGELLQLQHQLQAEMVQARDVAAEALRNLRQSGQASRSYQELAP